jgi:toxin ParE1/3/4
LVEIMNHSREQFGRDAQLRYERLLNSAMRDLATDPRRPGARPVEGAIREVWLCHSRHARNRLPAADRVGRPRHVLIFEVTGDIVRVLRVLHDAMDLPEHLRDI